MGLFRFLHDCCTGFRRMIRLRATMNSKHVLLADRIGSGYEGMVPRALCSARDSMVIPGAYANSICHRPDQLHLIVDGVRPTNPYEENLSLFGL